MILGLKGLKCNKNDYKILSLALVIEFLAF